MPAPPDAAICTEAEITGLVGSFYAAVRGDPVLGPIFAAHVRDWDTHLPKRVDFWSSVLRRTSRYRGTPLQAHFALPGLSAALFQRWHDLYRASTAGQPNPVLRERADTAALHIARSLWEGYARQKGSGRAADAAKLHAS
jgi:hemoglobin